MDDARTIVPPARLAAIERETRRLGFSMGSEPRTGALLRALAAGKPGGALLELGTGTGLGTAWLLHGMGARARLTSVEIDPEVAAVARRHLGDDPRLTLVVADAGAWLRDEADGPFDLVFADAVAGKYEDFEAAWRLLARGGLYLADDMTPVPDWPDEHVARRDRLLAALDARLDARVVRMAWSSGLVLAVRT